MASIWDDIRDIGFPKYKYKYFLENKFHIQEIEEKTKPPQ